MIHRALRLRSAIDHFVYNWSKDNISGLTLSETEWKQLGYLVELTFPFYSFTMDLEHGGGPSVHKVFDIYNALYDHLDDSKTRLRRKRTPWKSQVCGALDAALAKHLEYYNRTYRTEGYVYAIASILDPSKKMTAFDDESWKDDATDWKTLYGTVFKEVFTHYQTLYPDVERRVAQRDHLAGIDRSIQRFKRRRVLCDDAPIAEEIKRYIDEGK